jgi:hypothetical protein
VEPGCPVESLLCLAAALAAGEPPPRAVAAQFAAALQQWAMSDTPLEVALGLAGAPGVDAARTRHRRAVRNAHLRTAYALVPGPTPWAKATALAREIGRYQARAWPRWGHLAAPPPAAERLRTELFLAARAHPLPTTARALFGICAPK